jgi:hypothetical protein
MSRWLLLRDVVPAGDRQRRVRRRRPGVSGVHHRELRERHLQQLQRAELPLLLGLDLLSAFVGHVRRRGRRLRQLRSPAIRHLLDPRRLSLRRRRALRFRAALHERRLRVRLVVLRRRLLPGQSL